MVLYVHHMFLFQFLVANSYVAKTHIAKNMLFT